MIGTVFLRSMEIGAFFIQFLKWSEDKNSQFNSNSMPIPDAPKVYLFISNNFQKFSCIFILYLYFQSDIRSSQYMNKCPICLQKWKTPTVLSVSG